MTAAFIELVGRLLPYNRLRFLHYGFLYRAMRETQGRSSPHHAPKRNAEAQQTRLAEQGMGGHHPAHLCDGPDPIDGGRGRSLKIKSVTSARSPDDAGSAIVTSAAHNPTNPATPY